MSPINWLLVVEMTLLVLSNIYLATLCFRVEKHTGLYAHLFLIGCCLLVIYMRGRKRD